MNEDVLRILDSIKHNLSNNDEESGVSIEVDLEDLLVNYILDGDDLMIKRIQELHRIIGAMDKSEFSKKFDALYENIKYLG